MEEIADEQEMKQGVVEIIRMVRNRCTILRNYDVLGGHG